MEKAEPDAKTDAAAHAARADANRKAGAKDRPGAVGAAFMAVRMVVRFHAICGGHIVGDVRAIRPATPPRLDIAGRERGGGGAGAAIFVDLAFRRAIAAIGDTDRAPVGGALRRAELQAVRGAGAETEGGEYQKYMFHEGEHTIPSGENQAKYG